MSAWSLTLWSTGNPCDEDFGACTNEACESPCQDTTDNHPLEFDEGCDNSKPVCDRTGTEAVCVVCLVDTDCDADGNACTLDRCVLGVTFRFE